jgi:hypothetical protein
MESTLCGACFTPRGCDDLNSISERVLIGANDIGGRALRQLYSP